MELTKVELKYAKRKKHKKALFKNSVLYIIKIKLGKKT